MNDSIYIFDAATGEEIIREMTDEEQAQRDAENAAYFIAKQQQLDAEEAAWRTKVNAYEKLGLTPAEIDAIAPKPRHLVEAE